MRSSKVKLLLAVLALNALSLATLLTSSPQVSPASGWIVAVDRALYRLNLKSGGSLVELHANASRLSMEDCVACHGSMKSSKLALHKIHLTSDLLTGLKCMNCHDRIAMKPKSNARIVHVVNVGFCKKCHSEFSGKRPNSAMKPTDARADCTMCHSGKHAFRHAQPYLPQIVGTRECLVCHGGNVLPWSAQHERGDWMRKHGREALAANTSKCMKCHEYGLQFCNDCHRNKPPSHLPHEAWIARHKVAARAETRACFTCHKPAYCKKCHINHTPGWRWTHAKNVVKLGTETCLGCHSQTFCSSCHIGSRGKGSKASGI